MVKKLGNNQTGFDGLLSAHTEALKENSDEILKILQALNSKKKIMSSIELKGLSSIEKQIEKLNNDIDSIIEE